MSEEASDVFCFIFSGNGADAKLVHGNGAVVLDDDESLVIGRESLVLESGTGGLDYFGVARSQDLHPVFNALGFGSRALRFSD